MKEGRLWITIPLGLILVMVLYFLFNPSYERSLQAKFYYAIGDYPVAHTLAKEAFELDPYNRMAATVMAQSTTALKFVDYIDQARKYSERIAAMAEGETISTEDKARMKLMCEVMMDIYVKISPIRRDGRKIVIDKALLDEAADYHAKFVTLHEKVSQSL